MFHLINKTQAELVHFCKSNNLRSVNDPTNARPEYTARNAFRYQLTTLQDRLHEPEEGGGPVKLYRGWACRLVKRRDRLTSDIALLFRSVQWDTPVPSACTFDPRLVACKAPEIRRIFLARLAQANSPSSDHSSISPSSLAELDARIFGTSKKNDRRSVGKQEAITPGAGVMFSSTVVKSCRSWVVSRQPIRQSEVSALTYTLQEGSWHLWDNRFWIRYSHDKRESSEVKQIKIRPCGRWILPELTTSDGQTIWELSRGIDAGFSRFRMKVECRRVPAMKL
jgi:hypothetical protein